MTQFWIVGTSTQLNNLSQRYYSYEDAQAAAIEKATLDPTNTYLVLCLQGYTETTSATNVSFVEAEGNTPTEDEGDENEENN